MIASTTIRVRYKDTDCMKVVYDGNYLTYFEVGRVEFLRQQGLAMSDVDQRIHLPVVEATPAWIRARAPWWRCPPWLQERMPFVPSK